MPSLLLRLGLSLLLPVPVLAGTGDASAQEGALLVTVRAEETGGPLPGTQVSLRGSGIGEIADREGRVWLAGLPPGAHSVEARYLGYAPERALVVVEPGRTRSLEFYLSLRPIALAEVRVRGRPSLLHANGFYDRREGGLGTFLTREEIESMHPRYLSDVLRRVAGVTLSTSFTGAARASMRGARSNGGCPIQYYVDGALTAYFNADDVPPGDVEGMEIYRGAATIPPAFNRGTAMCGVIVIWTRMQ